MFLSEAFHPLFFFTSWPQKYKHLFSNISSFFRVYRAINLHQTCIRSLHTLFWILQQKMFAFYTTEEKHFKDKIISELDTSFWSILDINFPAFGDVNIQKLKNKRTFLNIFIFYIVYYFSITVNLKSDFF
jgi:hypothetical protein